MLHSILQTILFQLLFLLVYEVLLKKETFFTTNRCYLLLSLLISLVLPLLKFETLGTMVPAESFVMLPEVYIGTPANPSGTPEGMVTASEGFQKNWWWIAYSAGFGVSLMMFINKYRILRNLFQHNTIAKNKDLQIIQVPNSSLACTFCNTIFIGDQLKEEEISQILAHEKVHVRQKHSIDLLFFELLKVVFWFNPLIYIYQSRISTLHEFIADAQVAKIVEKKTYYQQLLNTAFSTENISFINQFFNHSLIKKRIVMLQKSRSKAASKLKFLVIILLMLGMLFYVSCTEEKKLAEIPQTVVKGEILELQVKATHNLGEEEATRRNKVVKPLGIEGNKINPIVRNETSSQEILVDNNSGTLPPPPPPPSFNKEVENTTQQKVKDIPFAVVDEVPVYPGCENLETDKEKKDCMAEKITRFVNSNFDTSLGKKLNLTGLSHVFVQFRINSDGVVEVMRVRAPHEALEEEARRVVNNLPEMVAPGKHNGKNVGVLYSLPISFMVNE